MSLMAAWHVMCYSLHELYASSCWFVFPALVMALHRATSWMLPSSIGSRECVACLLFLYVHACTCLNLCCLQAWYCVAELGC
jgi:hypothetical protein